MKRFRTLVYVCVLILGLCVMTVHAQGHWQDADLTAITGGPLTDFGSAAIDFDPVWNGMRTHYVAADNHVHELFLLGSQWQDADLTALTRGPNVSTDGIAIAFDPAWNGMRTHYVAEDRHVHELFLLSGRWQDADLTAITGAPDAARYDKIGIAFDPVWNGMRTHYVAANNHVHELFLGSGRWQDADLTAITGAPDAIGFGVGAIGIAFDPVWNGMRTHYVAADGHVHELFLGSGRWQDADLTAITRGPNVFGGSAIAIAFDPAWNGMRTHYVAGGHVHELFLGSGRWQDADLTAITGGPYVDDASKVAIAFDPAWNGMRTHYIVRSGQYGYDIHELFLSGSQWQDADLSAITGASPNGLTRIAIAFDPVWNGMRSHYASAAVPFYGHVHELFLVP